MRLVDQQREHDVAEHRLPRQQLVEFLEHHHAVGARPLDRLAVEPDLALDRRHEARDRLEQRRLAAAGRAEQHEAVALDRPRSRREGRGDEMLLGLVLQRHVVDGEQRRGRGRAWPPVALTFIHAIPSRSRGLPASLSPTLAVVVWSAQEKSRACAAVEGGHCMIRRLLAVAALAAALVVPRTLRRPRPMSCASPSNSASPTCNTW